MKNDRQFELIIGKLCASCNNVAGITFHHSKQWVSQRTLDNFVDIYYCKYTRIQETFNAILCNWKKILFIFQITTEAVVRRCSVKKVFLKISQNSQENTCTSHNYGNRSFCKSCKNIKFVHLLAISNIVRTQVPQYWPMSLTGFHSERFSCSFFLKWLAVD